MRIDVPEAVRVKAELAGAHGWLAGLPGLIADLERDWALTVGRPFRDATEAYVAEATLGDGTSAVLKLLIPRAEAFVAYEIGVLRLAGGRGCVALLRADPLRGAVLLERLGPALVDAGLALEARLEIMVAAAQAIWQPVAGVDLPTGAEKGRRLIAGIERSAGRIDERTRTYAIACAERRIAAHDDARAVVVHGDVHQWNTLRAGDGWKLVDPDGLVAEPECDLGVLMREDPVELMAGDPWERARWLAGRTGTDPVAIWEWGVVERLATGLLLDRLGLPVGTDMLAAAAELSRRAA
jgi:streptomycin 6-kinase